MASSNINEKVQQALEEGHPWESIKAHLSTIDSPEAKSYLSGLQSASSAQSGPQSKATPSSIKTGLLDFIEQNPEQAALYGAGAYALLQAPKIASKVADYRLKQRELGLKERSLTAYEAQVAKQGVAPESINPANELIDSVRQNEFQKQSPLNAYAEQKYGVPLADLEKVSGGKLKTTTDVDVVGGIHLKQIMAEKALSIFIQPPSMEELERRLTTRNTDSLEKIKMRLAKAKQEIEQAKDFDVIVVNDQLDLAIQTVHTAISRFIQE